MCERDAAVADILSGSAVPKSSDLIKEGVFKSLGFQPLKMIPNRGVEMSDTNHPVMWLYRAFQPVVGGASSGGERSCWGIIIVCKIQFEIC